MIPQLIHYTWFSSEPMPPQVLDCIASWHRYMPDWEYRLWDAKSLHEIPQSLWLSETLAAQKWAFASDLVRLYSLQKYGGVYLDTDCMVYRSLEPLLAHQAFIGREWQVHIDGANTWHYLSSHCMGAVAHHPFMERCYRYYQDRHFVLSNDDTLTDDLRYDQTLLPYIQCRLAMDLGYDPKASVVGIQRLNQELTIYPYSYFDAFDLKTNTYCRHLAMGSWWRVVSSQMHPTKAGIINSIRYRFNQWLRRFMWRRGFILTTKH